MKKRCKQATAEARAPERRCVLVVDGDEAFAHNLRSAWSQLGLDEDLHFVDGREQALDFLSHTQGKNGAHAVAAVVLDPDVTSEETAAFLRELRKRFSNRPVPIVFWTRDGEKYQVLEGRGVNAVIAKTTLLRLIAALDGACRVRVRSLPLFGGGLRSMTQGV